MPVSSVIQVSVVTHNEPLNTFGQNVLYYYYYYYKAKYAKRHIIVKFSLTTYCTSSSDVVHNDICRRVSQRRARAHGSFRVKVNGTCACACACPPLMVGRSVLVKQVKLSQQLLGMEARGNLCPRTGMESQRLPTAHAHAAGGNTARSLSPPPNQRCTSGPGASCSSKIL